MLQRKRGIHLILRDLGQDSGGPWRTWGIEVTDSTAMCTKDWRVLAGSQQDIQEISVVDRQYLKEGVSWGRKRQWCNKLRRNLDRDTLGLGTCMTGVMAKKEGGKTGCQITDPSQPDWILINSRHMFHTHWQLPRLKCSSVHPQRCLSHTSLNAFPWASSSRSLW